MRLLILVYLLLCSWAAVAAEKRVVVSSKHEKPGLRRGYKALCFHAGHLEGQCAAIAQAKHIEIGRTGEDCQPSKLIWESEENELGSFTQTLRVEVYDRAGQRLLYAIDSWTLSDQEDMSTEDHIALCRASFEDFRSNRREKSYQAATTMPPPRKEENLLIPMTARFTPITSAGNGEIAVETGLRLRNGLALMLRGGQTLYEYLGNCAEDQSNVQTGQILASYYFGKRFYVSAGLGHRYIRLQKFGASEDEDPDDWEGSTSCTHYLTAYAQRFEVPVAFGWTFRNGNIVWGIEALSANFPLYTRTERAKFDTGNKTFSHKDPAEAMTVLRDLRHRTEWRFATATLGIIF